MVPALKEVKGDEKQPYQHYTTGVCLKCAEDEIQGWLEGSRRQYFTRMNELSVD